MTVEEEDEDDAEDDTSEGDLFVLEDDSSLNICVGTVFRALRDFPLALFVEESATTQNMTIACPKTRNQ